jgi:signal peptidase II
MKRVPIIGLVAAVAVFLLDQFSKFFVTDVLGLDSLAGPTIELLPIFRMRFVANEGVSLGLLTADTDVARWALVALTGAIAIGVLIWMWRERNRQDQLALGLVLGGAAGNIIDRVRLGYVVDFADLHLGDWSPFLVFNLADAAITIGVLVLLVRAILVRDKPVAKVSVENGNA